MHFLSNLNRRFICGNLYKNCHDKDNKLATIFKDVLDHHAPTKQKKVRGNRVPFLTKDFSKAIMNKAKAKNKYIKWTFRENFLNLKKIKNR